MDAGVKNSSVIFLPVPSSLKAEIRHYSDVDFDVDPSILLPAELDDTRPESGPVFLPDELSWETILSGMLRVVSAQGKNTASYGGIKQGEIFTGHELAGIPPEWADYYRRFILTVKPGIYHEFTGAAVVKAKNGEFDMALEINAALEGLFPRSPGVLLNKALILENKAEAMEKNGRGAERENALALDAYETALAMEPVLPDTFFNAAFFFMRLRDFRRASECFSRYISTGEEEEKIARAEKIVREIGDQGLDDDNYREAYDLVNRGEDEKGLSRIRLFIEKYPRAWNGWFVLGWALRKLGRFSDGLESFRKAVELGGVNADLSNEMSICLMETGDLRGARSELLNALREEPENIKIISNLGALAMKNGNADEAAAFFRTALDIDPDDLPARRFLDLINREK
jgi:tetratricopeptide (TPR) repeat protein